MSLFFEKVVARWSYWSATQQVKSKVHPPNEDRIMRRVAKSVSTVIFVVQTTIVTVHCEVLLWYTVQNENAYIGYMRDKLIFPVRMELCIS